MRKETYAAPMSFVGSTKRILRWAAGSTARQVIGWIALPFIWLFLVLWYIIVLGIFGLFTIPFRLIRRSQRKSNALSQAQLDELKALRQEKAP
ncbi:MAG: hypothetical protein ABSF27_06380 [Candidatus Dormibacteria bacterium]